VASVISGSLNTILFLCHLKENVYKNKPLSLDEPKRNIQGCILNAMTEIPHTVASGMRKTVDACIAEHGGHFQHLLCKSVSVISVVE
jgi:hypothetical protein